MRTASNCLGVPGKSRYQFELTDEERAELEHRAACYSRPHLEVQRAKLVLYAAEGMDNTEIARRLDMPREVVGRWRRRFHEERLDGLSDLRNRRSQVRILSGALHESPAPAGFLLD